MHFEKFLLKVPFLVEAFCNTLMYQLKVFLARLHFYERNIVVWYRQFLDIHSVLFVNIFCLYNYWCREVEVFFVRQTGYYN